MRWTSQPNPQLLRAAADLARKATAEHPERPTHWVTLGRLLLDLADAPECVRHLSNAIFKFPECIELKLILARAMILAGEFENALVHIESVLAQVPNNRDVKVLYFELLHRMKNWEAAGDLAGEIAIISPTNWRLMAYYARSFDAETLVTFCDTRLRENQAHTAAQYYKALSLSKLGRVAEAREVISLGSLIDISNLPLPVGYQTMETFCTELAEEIKRNPTLACDPRGLATRDGFQTRQLRYPGAVAIEALLSQVKQAVEAYEKRVAGLPAGFATGRPAQVCLNSWAVVYGSDGHQKSHIHQASWLSGVFFVTAPRPHGENAYRGPLVLGALDCHDYDIEPSWGTLDVEPVPGRLVMFPSYLPHATLPTGIEGARIIVAFDVVPA